MKHADPNNKRGARVYKATPTPKTGPETPPQNKAPALQSDASVQNQGPLGAAPAAKPSSKGTPPPSKRKNTKQQKQMNVLIGCIVGGIVIVLAVVAIIWGLSGGEADSSLSGQTTESLVAIDGDYNKDADKIPVEKLIGTVLPESEEAGKEYVQDTLFLGDSNTLRMLSYRDVTNVTLLNGIGIESMGITEVTSLKCVQFKGVSGAVTMPEAVAIMQPRRVVITFGTNNAGGMGVDNFIKGYKDALDAIKKAYPSVDIIIGAVPPVDKYTSYSLSMTTIDKYNVALANLAEEEDCKFLNWSEALKDEKTGFSKTSYTIQDGIHISKAGMEAMFKYFRTHAFIGEDARPKPLKDIPLRQGTPPGLINSDPGKVEGPQSRSASSSSSKSSETVQITFNAQNGAEFGKITIGGQTSSSVMMPVEIGKAAPTAIAVPEIGYRFVRWECSEGAIANVESTELTFTMPASADPQRAITVTAVFEKIPEPPSSEAPPPSVSSELLPSVSSEAPLPEGEGNAAPPDEQPDNGAAGAALVG